MSLNEAVRRKERDAQAARLKLQEQIGGVKRRDDDGLQDGEGHRAERGGLRVGR